jgi:RimJ/RimL family protein N-acetyltransferase
VDPQRAERVEDGPARVPVRAPLRGPTYELRPLDAELDAERLFAAGHEPAGAGRQWTYLWYGPFEDAAAMREWLRGCATSADPLFFAVVDRASGDPVGMCSYMSIVPEMRRVEVAHIWYAPSRHGSGINTEVVLLLLAEAFERLGYRRVEWKCDALNERSRGAALKLGFTFEGIFRQHMIVKGRNRDTAWFSVIDREWPAVKAALLRRSPRP